MKWYVLKVQSNRENSIRETLLRRIKRESLESQFGQILVPVEKTSSTKTKQKRTSEQKLFPGYILIEMDLNDDTWFLVRSVSGVGDFTGPSGKPAPIDEAEIQNILKDQASDPQSNQQRSRYSKGDAVTIKDGAFDGFKGTVDSVDEVSGKITVLIEIFGRPTPIDLEPWQLINE